MPIIKYDTKKGKRYRAGFNYNGKRVCKGGFRRKEEAKQWMASERKRLNDSKKTSRPIALNSFEEYKQYIQSLYCDPINTICDIFDTIAKDFEINLDIKMYYK